MMPREVRIGRLTFTPECPPRKFLALAPSPLAELDMRPPRSLPSGRSMPEINYADSGQACLTTRTGAESAILG